LFKDGESNTAVPRALSTLSMVDPTLVF